MSDVKTPQPAHRFKVPEEDDVVAYHSVSGLAITALLLGLISFSALLGPAFWILPILAFVASLWALWQLSRYGSALVGRKAALVGLLLATTFGTAALTDWFVYREMVRREAVEFGMVWFECLKTGRPWAAMQLTEGPLTRSPLDKIPKPPAHAVVDTAPGFSSDPWKTMDYYVARPLVRLLLTLGDKAEARYYDTEFQGSEGDRDQINQIYAVTYSDGAEKKTFFVTLVMERSRLNKSQRSYWRVTQSDGGVQPVALGGPQRREP